MYRINTFEVNLPPLRERNGDIPELACHLLSGHKPALMKRAKSINDVFEAPVLEKLLTHAWPGNIRELANVIEYAAILCDKLPIGVGDLPQSMGPQPASSGRSLREMEMDSIWAALDACNGNKTAAAQQLGISIKTLYNKLNADTLNKKAG